MRELLERPGELRLDVHYYLAQQIHSVVTRLVEHVDGTDAVRIAVALGLDPASYRAAHRAQQNKAALAIDSLGDLAGVDTSHCEPFLFDCPECKAKCRVHLPYRQPVSQSRVGGMPLQTPDTVVYALDACEHCGGALAVKYMARLVNALQKQLRALAADYANAPLVCAKCAHETSAIAAETASGRYARCGQCREGAAAASVAN